jgi:hypothetical protein
VGSQVVNTIFDDRGGLRRLKGRPYEIPNSQFTIKNQPIPRTKI